MELNYQPFRREKSIRKALNNNPPLKRGSKGRGVEALQKGLVKCGHKLPDSTQSAGKFDGVFGKETAKVVTIFQKISGLTPSNGKAGSDTISALDKALSEHDKKQSKSPSTKTRITQQKFYEWDKLQLQSGVTAFVNAVTQATVDRPSAARLEREFNNFPAKPKSGRRPCMRTKKNQHDKEVPFIKHQCAVRMSVALSRSMGRDILEDFNGENKHSKRCCKEERGIPYAHITGATPLLKHLKKGSLGLTFEEYKNIKPHKIKPSQFERRKGIIFFVDCFDKKMKKDGKNVPFTRPDGTTGFKRSRGSHIDYWNGSTYTNRASGVGEPQKDLNLFEDATKIYFCELK